MIVLASSSPRRQQILKMVGIDFIVDPADIDEDLTLNLPPRKLVEYLSKQKAIEVASRHKQQMILAADTIVVPSGNFGNLVAGVMAKKMGLPVRLVAAVNENDGFPRFLRTGSYAPISPSIKCISNAMNVGNPSNLAHIVWLYGGRLDEGGKIKVLPDMESLRKDVLSVSITDGETRAAMKQAFAKGITLEPHGAVGWAAIQKLRNEQLGKTVLFETAHPAKFPEILDSLGIPYAIPDSLAGFESLEEHFVRISPDLDELKSVLNG